MPRRILMKGSKFAGTTKATRRPLGPSDMKRCSRCRELRQARWFGKDAAAVDGLRSDCRFCRCALEARRQAARKHALRLERWMKLSERSRNALVLDLLEAAGAAATAGMWRGHEAVRAYARLKVTLARFNREPVADSAQLAPSWNEAERQEELERPEPRIDVEP